MKLKTIILCITCLLPTIHFSVFSQTLKDIEKKISSKEQLTNLPTFYITTNSGNIPQRETYIKGELYIAGDPELSGKYNGGIEIRGRGNSYTTHPKKPYRIRLNEKYNLLGMPAQEEVWPILASYTDKTLMRHALAFEISRLCGIYFTPQCRYIDVVFNGNFIGSYLVTDQVERGTRRVNIEKLESTDVTYPKIEGGYLLEVDGWATGAEAFLSKHGTRVSIKYPKADNINQIQRDYIINHFNKLQEVVFAYDPTNPKALDDIKKYLDIEAFVNWYIAVELTANSDCIWSLNMKKERMKSQFFFGPIWDNDIAFANDSRRGDTRNKLIVPIAHPSSGFNPTIEIILLIPEVQQQITARWNEIKSNNPKEKLLSFIDSSKNIINKSQHLNFQKWQVLDKLLMYNLAIRGSYDAEVSFLRQFMSDRIDFLDKEFNKEQVTKEIDESYWVTIESLNGGKVIDIQDETRAVISDKRDSDNDTQLFRFLKIDTDTYIIINKGTDKVVAAQESGTRYMASIEIHDPENISQQWKIAHMGESIIIRNKYFPVYMALLGTSNGNPLNLSETFAFTSREWKLNKEEKHDLTTNTMNIHNTGNVIIYSGIGKLHVVNNNEKMIKVYNISGNLLFEEKTPNDHQTYNLPSGIYIVKTENINSIILIK